MSAHTLDLELPLFAVPLPDFVGVIDGAQEINGMTYEEMLRMVRCAPLDHPLFRGEVGKIFHATMKARRGQLSPEARAEISQRVGF